MYKPWCLTCPAVPYTLLVWEGDNVQNEGEVHQRCPGGCGIQWWWMSWWHKVEIWVRVMWDKVSMGWRGKEGMTWVQVHG